MTKLSSIGWLVLTVMAVLGLACVPQSASAAPDADAATLTQMKATLDGIQQAISELSGKVAPAPAKTMTVAEIASEVKRITEEKDALAVKVQNYVAAHPGSTLASSNMTTADVAVQVARIKQEILDLNAVLAMRRGVSPGQTAVAEKTAAPAEVKTEIAVTVPSSTIANTAPTVPPVSGTPSISISPDGTVSGLPAESGKTQAQTPAAQTQGKGLIQRIGDYVKSLFKF